MHHPAVLFPVQGAPPFSSSTIVAFFLFYTLDTRYFFFPLSIFSSLLLCLFFHTLYISPYSLLHYSSISMPLNNFHTIYSSVSLQRQNHILGFPLSWYLYSCTHHTLQMSPPTTLSSNLSLLMLCLSGACPICHYTSMPFSIEDIPASSLPAVPFVASPHTLLLPLVVSFLLLC